MSVRFRFDWVDAPPSPDRLSRHTMAALSIEADGAIVTAVLDRSSRSLRDHVIVPLAPVAEWLVGNWWHLFHEVENRHRPWSSPPSARVTTDPPTANPCEHGLGKWPADFVSLSPIGFPE